MLRFVALLSLLALAFAKECGTRVGTFSDDYLNRIVGGVDADAHEFPWQVSWRYLNLTTKVHRHICGASIIMDQWVLTAAHCVDLNQDNTANETLFLAGVGWHLQDTVNKDQQTIEVEKIFLHPGWNSQTLTNDIALVKLKKKIGLDKSDNINAICIGNPADDTEGNSATISGWGLTKNGGDTIPNVLQKAVVKVERQKTCKSRYGIIIGILDSHVCAGYNPGVCNGDSGGPLQYQKNNKWYLLGATSFGAGGCGSTVFPGVFTRCPYFTQWVKDTTGETLPQ